MDEFGRLLRGQSPGWFTQEGLDVELTVADPSRGDSLAYLSRYEADFAVFPSNRLLVRRAAHEPLKAVAAINHRGMETILTTTRPVSPGRVSWRAPAGPEPDARGLAMVRHLVEADGGDFDRVVVVNSAPGNCWPTTWRPARWTPPSATTGPGTRCSAGFPWRTG